MDELIYFDGLGEVIVKERTCIGNVVFTKAGQALYQSIDVNKLEGFWENRKKGKNGNTLSTENQ